MKLRAEEKQAINDAIKADQQDSEVLRWLDSIIEAGGQNGSKIMADQNDAKMKAELLGWALEHLKLD